MTDENTASHDGIDRRQLGAISILLGNAALFANGLIAFTKGNNAEVRKAGLGRMASGALYSGTGFILKQYGSQPVAEQLERAESRLAAYLKEQGVPLDVEQLKKADHEQQKNWFAKLQDFAYDYPMECANVYNAAATIGMLGSGILRRRRGEYSAGNANIANTLLVMAGTLTSVLTPERTPEQIEKQGDSGTLWGKMQEQPLNFAVWPFMAADVSFAMQAYGEYQSAKQVPRHDAFHAWAHAMPAISAVVVAASLAGDILTGFSSKKVGGSPEDRAFAQQELVKSAAHIVALQPPDTQKMLAEKAADYLVHQQALRLVDLNPHELADRILDTARLQNVSPSALSAHPEVSR